MDDACFWNGRVQMSLNWFARRWLRQAVEAKAKEAIAGRGGANRQAIESPPDRCDVVLVFALEIEEEAFLRRLSAPVTMRAAAFKVQLCQLGSQQLAIACSGPGRKSAARAAEILIEAHHPRLVVAAGLAGGLSPELKRFDVVLGSQVQTAERQTLELAAPHVADRQLEVGQLHVGPIFTSDRIVTRAVEKAALYEQHRAIAVDMESFAIAEVCREHNCPCLVVRVISDPHDQSLPPQVERLLQQKSLPSKAGGLLATIAGGPKTVGQLWKLKETAFEAAERLAEFLAEMIRGFPPRDG